ncbi:helix-turn-helix transcriptional regulator [Nostoc sp. NMS8]|uniref:helix-turn-helix transcriptional regulator n=1 Tax=Nostoc sp. NMS8 TaxID=2815392 RepID=UPI0025D96F5A|nr:helix-turn-helix transcriptional regulator [Nostoc sp. NMS8]MBN3959241.1 helix-turn-helix transcriptional regulator [Nostoc sp. NMS8]
MNSELENEPPTLKTLRESADLTQPQLSQRLGVGIRIIGDWESGRKMPRFDNAIALARELGASLKELARSMRMDVSSIADDGISLAQLKTLCRELNITEVNDLPDDWRQLKRSRPSYDKRQMTDEE